MEDKEKSTVNLNIRMKPSVKEAGQKRAEEEGRSFSNYIEWLILQDVKRNS